MPSFQRKLLIGALVAVVVTMLFPPFTTNKAQFASNGFHFILLWPSTATVDTSLLLTEWLAVAIVCIILWVLKRDPNARNAGILTRALNLYETRTNARIDAIRDIAEAATEIANTIVEKNAEARVEAAKITADAAIYTVNVQSQMGDK